MERTSLLYGAVTFIVGIFGGLVWILSAEKAARGTTSMEIPEQPLPRTE